MLAAMTPPADVCWRCAIEYRQLTDTSRRFPPPAAARGALRAAHTLPRCRAQRMHCYADSAICADAACRYAMLMPTYLLMMPCAMALRRLCAGAAAARCYRRPSPVLRAYGAFRALPHRRVTRGAAFDVT